MHRNDYKSEEKMQVLTEGVFEMVNQAEKNLEKVQMPSLTGSQKIFFNAAKQWLRTAKSKLSYEKDESSVAGQAQDVEQEQVVAT